MSGALLEWKDKDVCVITCDGRFIQGKLVGYDQLQNLILKDAQERTYQLPLPPPDSEGEQENILEIVPLGLYIIRGDNVAIISDVKDGIFKSQASDGYADFANAEDIKAVVQARV
uniref:U6 snRNA-associated Sm-like protein LSm8 n=1 Tax=Chaetoceros debilis TaxID=122233 RepID=A0A7S3PYD1_9STRA|mmetsp:Transcript_28563/g.43714  ORF Transcript_28563/g.43714 Transcript_28563/m.43714 type:complete len:115 (+) Transcript_28563:133-477(+)